MNQLTGFDFARLAPPERDEELPYAIAAQENRSSPRRRIIIPATLRASGATGFKVTVRDLSQSGFSCEAVTGMAAGTRCWLTLPGIVAQQARLVWNDGIAVGGEFENILAESVLDAMLARYSMAFVD